MLALRHCGDDVLIPGWLRHANSALTSLSSQRTCPDDSKEAKQWQTELEIENVQLQLKHLRTYKMVRDAEREERLTVIGLYYHMTTARLEIIDAGDEIRNK
ncbi:MAG: hypothetical protein JXA44_01505 [Methanospirillaceae archaeon]|nr:hypothetical protein [Methanospirillaceae archaeon]